ncbi:Oidioi.mRNA.OKI2018_I69.PAR.g11935.t1.cds [Oikopleura dioica]|uniref:Trafficking protein particle complex subunit 2-like protein n=1 Tax=Oikopleura dioica TaxID=34765 RepID=A0ABN7S124_OIKDI|nr:Oidioi.mRNA.OKI2018_I69.PAR.g11935.t1.cds [Oikopleura dioica]
MCDSLMVIAANNTPIYQGFKEGANELELSFCAYSSLDVMDEKTTETQDIFLGTLYENETHRVYGYCPPSRMKFLALYKTSNQIVENQVKAKLRTLHTNYIKASANPFYQHGTILSTPSFVAASEELMSQD